MPFSNLHNFHFAFKLQNALALPEEIYRKISNRRAVNTVLPLSKSRTKYSKPANKRSYRPIADKNPTHQDDINQYNEPPFNEPRDPVTLEGQSNIVLTETKPPVIIDSVPTRVKNTRTSPDRQQAENIQAIRRSARKYFKYQSTHTKPTTVKKSVWKAGRGAIERIDKHSGEIVHLVEEYVSQ